MPSQLLGGWESVEMMRKYVHLSTTHLAEYVDRVSKLKVVASEGEVTNQLRAQTEMKKARIAASL